MTGLDEALLDVLLARVEAEVTSGRLPAAQVAVAQDGDLLATRTFGAADDTTRFVLQSCGRTIVATTAWKLISDGRLDITRPVGDYIEQFAAGAKAAITVEQVLTHTAGIPKAPLGYPDMLSRDTRLAAFATWEPRWQPGSKLEFHLTSSAWIVEQLCFALTGSPLADYVRSEIAGPLGLDSVEIGPAVDTPDIAGFVRTPGQDADEVNPWGPWYLGDRDVLAGGEPSHSSVATAADLAMFYQALLDPEPIWRRDVVADALRVRVTMPVEGERGGTRSVPGNVALFVVVAGDDGLPRAFLPTTGSPELFGHGGAAYQLAFADPVTGLSFAFLTNGYPASGYDQSPAGRAIITNIGNLAAELGWARSGIRKVDAT